MNKYEYPKCLLCIRHIKLKLNDHLVKNYLLSFGTDGCLLFWKLNFIEEEKPQKIEKMNQSGINDVDVWQSLDLDKILVVTVGDDTRISLVEIEIDKQENLRSNFEIKLDKAHASAVIGKIRKLKKKPD